MISRREFLASSAGILTLLPVGVQGDSGSLRPESPRMRGLKPEETAQDLIEQIWALEWGPVNDGREWGQGNRAHIRAIEDRIRVKLFMVGMACVYRDGGKVEHLCALCTRTGSLFTLPLMGVSPAGLRDRLRGIGLEGLDLENVPRAWEI